MCLSFLCAYRVYGCVLCYCVCCFDCVFVGGAFLSEVCLLMVVAACSYDVDVYAVCVGCLCIVWGVFLVVLVVCFELLLLLI